MQKPTEQEIFTLLQKEEKKKELEALPTPAYLIDEDKLRANGANLNQIKPIKVITTDVQKEFFFDRIIK